MQPFKTYEVLILSQEKRRVKIHCRCGRDFVEEMPTFMTQISEMQVILRCPHCRQPYGSAMGKVARLDPETCMPMKMIKEAEFSSVTTAGDVEAKLRAEGKQISPGSKAIN